MVLTPDRINQAKAEARGFLEYSIFMLCSLLIVDFESLTSPYDIPVGETDQNYPNYLALARQVAALEAISE